MGERRLEFFFDYSSPFGYLASKAVRDVAERHDAELVLKPILLGALFRKIGTPDVPFNEMSEPKRRYIEKDLERWAERRGAQLAWPTSFPLRTVKPLRMTLLAPDEQRWPLIDELMRVCWVDDQDPNDDAVLAECARRAGVDPALVERTRDDDAKAALRATTEEAIERGVPGVPTFFVDGDVMFWGQDRLDFVERALDGWRPERG